MSHPTCISTGYTPTEAEVVAQGRCDSYRSTAKHLRTVLDRDRGGFTPAQRIELLERIGRFETQAHEQEAIVKRERGL